MNGVGRRGLLVNTMCGMLLTVLLSAGDALGQAIPQEATAYPSKDTTTDESPFVVLLGVAQDAGYPQAGCQKSCCARAWNDPTARRHVVSLAIVDPKSKQRWLIDCTPDFRDQLQLLDRVAPPDQSPGIAGILLTHAHIGHYTGLTHLGREVMGVRQMPVHAMPRMREFLEKNGPWDQLVTLRNIVLHDLADSSTVQLSDRIRVTPLLVPHRDEYSETVGFRIDGPKRSVLFLPDIDKWERWATRIEDVLQEVDVAYVDGTFFAEVELPGRNMSEIPHPFIVESMQRFRVLPPAERGKVRFVHFNHTNPVLDSRSPAARRVHAAGYHIAEQGERTAL